MVTASHPDHFLLPADFSFLFGQQDIDLRALTHVPVPFPPPLPDRSLVGRHSFPDQQVGRGLDVDIRIPFPFVADGIHQPPVPFYPAHVPLQPLHPNLTLQSYPLPDAATNGFTSQYSRRSEPLLVDLTADEEPYQNSHNGTGGNRRADRWPLPDAGTDALAMKQVLDRAQALVSPYEPSDSTLIPISSGDPLSVSSTPLRDDMSVVDDWLENALMQHAPQSPARMSAKQSNQKAQKIGQWTASPTREMRRSGSGDKRTRSSSSSNCWDKRRKSENGDVYRYKEIRVIDQRTVRKSDPRPGVRVSESQVSSNARSRRKIKRQEARKVHTVPAAAVAAPAATIPVPEVTPETMLTGDMRDAPIEVLMAHVERIKSQLLALSEAEKQGSGSPVAHERPVSQTEGPAAAGVSGKTAEEEEEDDIGELRRIAILSMRAKALEETAVAMSSPVPPLSQNDQKEDEDEDVETLRQQLLLSMQQQRDKRTETVSQIVTSVPSVPMHPGVTTPPARRVIPNRSSDTGNSERIVIEFGNSSDSESGDEVTTAEPPGLSSLLAAARNNCIVPEIPDDLPPSIRKLTIDQQREYIRLKNEIAKREKNVDTATPLLAANEKKYKQLSESISNKRTKLNAIKESVAKKKDQYLKADAHAKKMEELLAAANKMVQHTMGELRRLAEEMTVTQQALIAESAEVRSVDQECLRLGKEVQGASYVQPSKRVNKVAAQSRPSANIVEEKNRLMARKSAILSLVQEKRSSGHTSFAAKRKMVRSSHRKLPALHALRKCNISRNGRENKDPKSAKAKKKKRPAKEENFEVSVALLFDRHLKEKAKEEAAGVAAMEYLVERPPIVVPHTECVLLGMPSFRLSPLFHKVQKQSLLSNTYSNALDPFQVVCYFDLHGVCKDPKCEMQHKSSYLLKDREKLMDIVSYRPALAGLSGNDLLDNQMVYERLEEFVGRYTASHPLKSVNWCANQLMQRVRRQRASVSGSGRAGRPDYSHRPSFDVRRFKYAFNGELNSDGTEVSPGASDSDEE